MILMYTIKCDVIFIDNNLNLKLFRFKTNFLSFLYGLRISMRKVLGNLLFI